MSEFGVPREARSLETRVGLTPAGVLALIQAGHTVYVQSQAGASAGFQDATYEEAGAHIVYTASEVYGRSEIIAKIARPTTAEYELFRPGQTVFSFLHLLVASPDLLAALKAHRITAVAYEMIEDAQGSRPVLLPASEIAGRMSPLIAGQLLASYQPFLDQHGLGILLSGLPGVPAAVVVIVGGGVLGINAARAFLGLGAEVTILDKDGHKLRYLDQQFQGHVTTMFASEYNLKRAVQFADVLVGAAALPGQRAPVLIRQEMVSQMRPGSVVIDFSIDQGGCLETSRPTTLSDPAYVSAGVIHYCVPNVTAAFARTTSYAITNAALPYLLAVGEHGWLEALDHEPALAKGVNLYQGKVAHEGLAAALTEPSVFHLSKP